MKKTQPKANGSRFEFRIWGKDKQLVQRLAELADVERRQRQEDCYLLVGDPKLNAKIRHRRLKIKRLVDEDSGFQRWASTWPRRTDDAPEPFAKLMAELGEQGFGNGKLCALAAQINELTDDLGITAITAVKERRRFKLGSIRAESAELWIGDRSKPYRTIAIEGRKLGELVTLRSTLKLDDVSNLPIHVALDPDLAETANGAMSQL